MTVFASCNNPGPIQNEDPNLRYPRIRIILPSVSYLENRISRYAFLNAWQASQENCHPSIAMYELLTIYCDSDHHKSERISTY
jgi:hypothetical protein